MHPTEQAPSTDVQQPAEPAQATEDSQSSDDQDSRSWWDRLTSRFIAREDPEPEDAETPPAETPAVRTMTEEEFQRAIQSEADRREAKRARDAAEAERRRLRTEDPWAYAEQEQAAEDAQQADQKLNELLAGIGQAHDAVTLKPLMDTLPAAEQQRLMALPGAGEGVDGRRLLTTEALKSLEKHWRAEGAKDAEKKLRTNAAFRRQVASDLYGANAEPELIPSGNGSAPRTNSEDINNLFRSQVGLPTTR